MSMILKIGVLKWNVKFIEAEFFRCIEENDKIENEERGWFMVETCLIYSED